MTRFNSTLLAVLLLTASPVVRANQHHRRLGHHRNSPQGANTTPATFKQEGDKVSGMFKSPQGSCRSTAAR